MHTSRSNRTTDLSSVHPVGSTLPIPHGSEYSASLCVPEFKTNLVDLITTKFLIMAQGSNTNMVIDSPSLDNPVYMCNGILSSIGANQHGEADYALWHHTIHCNGMNCLVVASDTDVWVYGLGLCEAGWLRNKMVIVQRGNSGEYVNINLGTHLIQDFPSLHTVSNPVSTIVAMYVLTGCDYMSALSLNTLKKISLSACSVIYNTYCLITP